MATFLFKKESKEKKTIFNREKSSISKTIIFYLFIFFHILFCRIVLFFFDQNRNLRNKTNPLSEKVILIQYMSTVHLTPLMCMRACARNQSFDFKEMEKNEN